MPSVGAAVSSLAGMEALEALRVITGMGAASEGVLTTIDLGTMAVERTELPADPGCPSCRS